MDARISMPKKRQKQIKQRKRRKQARELDFPESPIYTPQKDLAQLAQRAKEHPDTLEDQDVLQLQSVIGNHAMGKLLGQSSNNFSDTLSYTLQRNKEDEFTNQQAENTIADTIQRSEYDNPNDFITWFQQQEIYTKWLSDNGGDCAPSSKDIGEFLEKMFEDHADVTVQYRGISFLTPYSFRAANNMPHFVVTVTWGGGTVVIDPTQEQFEGGTNQIAENSAWENGFASLPGQFSDPDFSTVSAITPKVYADFSSFEDANAFVKGNIYKTSEDNPVIGKEIGNWVSPRVARIAATQAPAPKKKKKNIFKRLFG